MKEHKHKGVERVGGSLRSHPIKRFHKDTKTQTYHNKALTGNEKGKFSQGKTESTFSALKKTITKKKQNQVMCIIDTDGYINIDLDNSDDNIIGLRVKFTRVEGRTKRNVALAINKR